MLDAGLGKRCTGCDILLCLPEALLEAGQCGARRIRATLCEIFLSMRTMAELLAGSPLQDGLCLSGLSRMVCPGEYDVSSPCPAGDHRGVVICGSITLGVREGKDCLPVKVSVAPAGRWERASVKWFSPESESVFSGRWVLGEERQ